MSTGTYKYNVRRANSIKEQLEQVMSQDIISSHEVIDRIILLDIVKMGKRETSISFKSDVPLSVRSQNRAPGIFIDGYSKENFELLVGIVVGELTCAGWNVTPTHTKNGIDLTLTVPSYLL